jgi:hypothetical protein
LSALARWVAAVALGGASLAQAQDTLEQRKGQDTLNMGPPASWEGGWAQTSNQRGEGWSRVDFLPAKQTPDARRQAIALLEIWGGSQRDGAARLLAAWEADVRKTCPEASAARTTARNANGFSVLYVQFLCPRRSDTGEGVLHLVKTISSDKHTFLVASVRSSPPFALSGTTVQYADSGEAEALNRWLRAMDPYLENIRACDAHSHLVTVCSP